MTLTDADLGTSAAPVIKEARTDGAPAFFSLLRDWRAAGSLDGLELGREESSPKGAQ